MEHTQFVTRNLFHTRLRAVALGVVGLALMPALAPAATAPEPSSAVKAQVQSSYGKLPLSFEANQGQTDSQVKFLARGRGYALFLTPTEAVLSLSKAQLQLGAPTPVESPSSLGVSGTVLTMQLLGANPVPRVIGKDALPGRVNYLRGKDPANWQTQIPTYAKVAYEGIYPGLDLVYYGNQGQLEYDFVVGPGADPGAVKLAFRGADRLEINTAGELLLHTPSGDIRMRKPVVYQEVAGVRTTVDVGYVLEETERVSFEVAAYDTSRPLVIDPVLVYSTYLGGSGDDSGNGIAVDLLGNAHVTGNTSSADFPTANALQSALGGGSNAFVAKLNRDGDRLLYSTYLGGSGIDSGKGIAVDLLGNTYVTGNTSSADFPTANALQSALGGGSDAFVAKLNRDGDRLLYSTYLGGSGIDSGKGIAVDLLGNTYVTGNTSSADFPTANALQSALGGVSDAFVVKLNRDGDRLLYSTYLGGSSGGIACEIPGGFGCDDGHGIAVDLLGNTYITGSTFSSNFPTVNAEQSALGGVSDAFVAKLNRDGDRLLYSTYLGGRAHDFGNGIAVDLLGDAHVTGRTFSTDFPTVAAMQSTLHGVQDAFVAKLNRDGDRLLYSTYLGGHESQIVAGFSDSGTGIAVDRLGNTYVAGQTFSSDFPTANALQPVVGGTIDAFVAKLNRDGDRLLYSTYLGGSGVDFGKGIAVDLLGNAYVAGQTFSSDFPTANALQSALGGGSDAFVAKLGR